MNKIAYILLFVVVAACSNTEKAKQESADGGWDVTVTGKVKFPGTGKVLITELTNEENGYTDSVAVSADGSYTKTIHLKEPGYYRVDFYDVQSVNLVLDKSNVTLNVDGNDQAGAVEIIGSPDYELVREVQNQLQAFQNSAEIQQLQVDFQNANQNQQEEQVSKLQEQYIELMNKTNDAIVKGLESKSVNLGMINLLQSTTFQDKDRYYTFYQQVAEKATKEYPTSTHMRQFADMVKEMAITAVGQKAPEISLPDTNGNIVTLSSFQGKYVLVDFWAKWCGPCRRENPNVVKAYNKYKKYNFTILGVSLDRTKEDWLQAIEQDGLTWNHVSDLKYFQSQAAIDYHITGIPFSILVDPNGVIIAKNLRASALHKKLKEVFEK